MTSERFNKRRIIQLYTGKSYGEAARQCFAHGWYDFYDFICRWLS